VIQPATNFDWLDVPAENAARRLLGCELMRDIDGQEVRVRIVETEAYDQTDEASHTFKGRTKRNDAMFKAAGHMYVYFTYGMHYCCNIVCGKDGYGSGVLIRAVEPLSGLDVIERRRGMTGVNVTNGPGKICQALGIDLTLSGHDLSQPPMRLIKKPALSDDEVTIGARIGISKAVHELRRFYVTSSPFVSKK
jgi:DNA-3-methyladenine glycosylase